MADKKISELTNITGANLADADEFVVVDTSANETKAITYGELKKFTGTVTADGLIVADGTSGQVNIHSTSYNIQGGTAYGDMRYNAPRFRFYEDGTTLRMNIDNGDISFYEDTGTTPKFFWDASAESLGIGTSSPNATLHVVGTEARIQSDNGFVSFYNSANSSRSGYIQIPTAAEMRIWGQVSQPMLFGTSNTERLRIDASGNVGIGTSSPTGSLDVARSGSHEVVIRTTSTGDPTINLQADGQNNGKISYVRATEGLTFSNGGTERMRLNSDGSVYWKPDGTTQAMTLDASGNLLVGTTDSNPVANNVTSGIQFGDGRIRASRADRAVLVINRKTSDGTIAEFRKDGSTVGSIGAKEGDLAIGNNDTGIIFNASGDSIIPFNMSSNAGRDNAVDLGIAAFRYKDLYLSGGVYLGGTGAANKLDDYEEGTWTPTFEGETVAGTASGGSPQTAYYVKVGQQITIWGNINYSSHTGSGNIKLVGLPFSSAYAATGSVMTDSYNWSGNTMITAYISASQNYIRFYTSGDNVAWLRQQITSETQDWYFSMTYRTNV